jgi:hypothetical protein
MRVIATTAAAANAVKTTKTASSASTHGKLITRDASALMSTSIDRKQNAKMPCAQHS